MLQDGYETFGRSLLHHGPLNRRAYLVQLAPEEAEDMPGRLAALARERGYTKLLARLPRSCSRPFAAAGFSVEAELPLYFQGQEDCLFMARYLEKTRSRPQAPKLVREVLDHALQAPPVASTAGADVNDLGPDACRDLAGLYSAVFQAYPFPVFEPEYIEKCMAAGYRYCGVHKEGRLAAAACAEPDLEAGAMELTDFATLPRYRRQGLAGILLRHLDRRMQEHGVLTRFTICRATSWGMNRAFAASGFAHAGTLWNNTHFDGRLEDMNVWTKA